MLKQIKKHVTKLASLVALVVITTIAYLLGEFQCAVDVWNTSCGKDNGRIYVYIDGGVAPYHVQIKNNQTGQMIKDIWTNNSPVEQLNLPAGTYRIEVHDSRPLPDVPNEYILNAAEVKASSAPVLSITSKSNENCNDGKGSIQVSAQSGVPPYVYKILGTNQSNSTGLFQNLKAGTYLIEGSDANFCSDTKSVLILNKCDSIFSKQILQKTTCDSLKSLKLDTVKTGKGWGTQTDSFTITKYNFIPKFTNWLYDLSCNPADTGSFFIGKFANVYGCDSLVWKHVGYAPKGIYTFETIKTYCAGTEGTDTIFSRSQNGCDSNHITTRILEGVRTIFMPTLNTCWSRPDSIYVAKSSEGCDSALLVTHFNVLPKDTIRLTSTWCELKGPDTLYFVNQHGCESMKITKYTVKPIDTTFLNFTTCDPAKTGKHIRNLLSAKGCDSVVVENGNLFQKLDTTRITIYECGLKKPVHKQFILSNHFGCDSLVIIDSLVANSVIKQLPLTRTCDKSLSGNFVDTLATIYGCDSIVKWSVAYVAPYRKVNISYVCDKSQAGVFPHFFQNQYGCDSTVVDSIIYAGSTPMILTDSTICGSKNSETMLVKNLKNQYGCDSVVKQKLITFENVVGKIDNFAHVPAPGQKGFIETSAKGGKLPYTWEWNTGETTDDIYNLSGGNYVLTITTADGCKDTIQRGIAYFRAWSDSRGILTVGCGLADQSHFVDYGSQYGHLVVYDVNGTKLHEIQRVDMSVENIFKIPISVKGKVIVMMYFDSGATPLKDSSVSF